MAAAGCDLLCIGPHTDDAELAFGGTIHLLASRGRRVWICDLSRGELASNADPEERWQEARAAGEVLGIAGRCQLTLPDGFISPDDRVQVEALVWIVRCLKPRWIVSVPEPRRHPDHVATPEIVRRAVFLACLATLEPSQPPVRWWPHAPTDPRPDVWIPQVVGSICLPGEMPSAVFDVSQHWEAKTQALGCYASQFRRDPERRATHINDPDFLARVEHRARDWGRRVGATYGEAITTDAVPILDDIPAEGWQ